MKEWHFLKKVFNFTSFNPVAELGMCPLPVTFYNVSFAPEKLPVFEFLSCVIEMLQLGKSVVLLTWQV